MCRSAGCLGEAAALEALAHRFGERAHDQVLR
jgi:hypothetical protein